MEQYGLVVKNKGETATVNLQKHLTCEKCGRCGILSGSSKGNTEIEAQNPINAEVGQKVLLESDSRMMLFISFMLYMVPLIGLMVGIFSWLAVADNLGFTGDQDLPAIGLGLLFMAGIFLLIRTWDRNVKDNSKYQPIITELIVDEENQEECPDEGL
ncbi:MAG: SoxR reducing system RseC family protein [Bacillota bacterium]